MQRPNFGSENNEQLTNSSCASSFTSSGIGSTLRTVTWTPPHSIGTATPTHTEGTPSMTESIIHSLISYLSNPSVK
ncbi:Phosphatidylinositol 4-phosphate 5-kinase type-1 beta [Blomia tropicalis]|nr:Phosphatidylinositol 4-phosphate 5-kinase type-1 beta [Blomia tropicalis]